MRPDNESQIMKLVELMRRTWRRTVRLGARFILPSLFTFLLLSVFLASGWVAGETSRANAVGEITYLIEQGAFSSPVQLLQGSGSVVDFYGWDMTSSSTDQIDLTLDRTSQLFLYEDDTGEISVVAIHGRVATHAGTANFQLSGVPAGAAWVVMDDGVAFDSYSLSPPTGSAVWAWDPCCTDGGALEGGFNGAFVLTIDPDFTNISDWDFLSGPSALSPTRIAIPSLTDPLTIRATKLAAPTPTQTPCLPGEIKNPSGCKPVGGIGLDPDLSALPAGTPGSSGGGIGVVTPIAAGTTGVVALAGAAWVARRRRAR